jgi:putative ABC transport system permease protein
MSFFALVVENVMRRPGRSFLTSSGVAIGIAAVVILMSLASGFERSWGAAYNASGADLLVGKITTRRPLPTPFPGTAAAELGSLPQVAQAASVLTDLLSVEEAPAVLVFGWEPKSFLWDHLTLIEGRWPADDTERTVALGTVAAEMLGKSLGDPVQIETLEYRVCGRFASQALSENGAILMTLRQLQSVTGREDQVNFVTLKLKPGAGPEALDAVRAEVRRRFSGFSAETSGEVVRRNIAIQAAKAMSLATSLVALVIGAVGITNTVLMSVLERRHEIAVLLALGWRRTRIVKMIVIESALLSVVGGLTGVVIGFAALHALQWASWFRGKIDTQASVWLLGSAVLLSVCLGALCGLYPAWRGVRTPVIDGLYHE